MTPELEKALPVLTRYAELFALHYREKWLPSSEHISLTLQLLKSPLPGFEPYTPDELVQRLEVFFESKDAWVISCRHSYAAFVKHIHRFLPKKAIETQMARLRFEPKRCGDCGQDLGENGLCPGCYPKCASCGESHAVGESCEDVAARLQRIKALFSGPDVRSGSSQSLKQLLG